MNNVKHDKHMELCAKLHQTYKQKNHDYGDSFSATFTEFGVVSSLVRMCDKFNRLKTLSKNEAMVRDESITDTLADLANYCLMTIIELDTTKQTESYALDLNDLLNFDDNNSEVGDRA